MPGEKGHEDEGPPMADAWSLPGTSVSLTLYRIETKLDQAIRDNEAAFDLKADMSVVTDLQVRVGTLEKTIEHEEFLRQDRENRAEQRMMRFRWFVGTAIAILTVIVMAPAFVIWIDHVFS